MIMGSTCVPMAAKFSVNSVSSFSLSATALCRRVDLSTALSAASMDASRGAVGTSKSNERECYKMV